MTPREQAAFDAGIEAVRQMALAAAVTLETRPDGTGLRHQAAAAALQALAEGALALTSTAQEDRGEEPPLSLNRRLRGMLAETPLWRDRDHRAEERSR